MKIKVLRQWDPFSTPHWESFDYDGTRDISVAGLLDQLNYHDGIVTDSGERTSRIAWERSCLQGVCGACAMLVNDEPALACETFLRDLEGDVVTLRPLSKFPALRDLVVDREAIQESLKETNVFIGEYHPKDGENHNLQYSAAKCLKCGICLEACPNYTGEDGFLGAVFSNDCYLVFTRNREKSEDILGTYAQHFGDTCSKSLACAKACPMHIPTIALMKRLDQ